MGATPCATAAQADHARGVGADALGSGGPSVPRLLTPDEGRHPGGKAGGEGDGGTFTIMRSGPDCHGGSRPP